MNIAEHTSEHKPNTREAIRYSMLPALLQSTVQFFYKLRIYAFNRTYGSHFTFPYIRTCNTYIIAHTSVARHHPNTLYIEVFHQ